MRINEISENISHTSKRLRDIERNKKVKPGTDEWFKLWFSLPYLKEAKENIYDILEPEECGPFDGGCVLVAQALQQIHGGDIVVLINDRGNADHAAVKIGNTLIDYDGPLPVEKFIKRFEKNEHVKVTGIRPMKDSDLPEATRNQSLLPKIVDLLSNKKSKKIKEALRKRETSEAVNEGYHLQLERDPNMYILHITDTKTGKRTEVRGKPDYETTGYDANDPLHKLLDKIGKASSISDLMNGDLVGVNPRHPDGSKAMDATTKAFNEETGSEMLKIFRTMHHDTAKNKEMDAFIKSHNWKLADFTPDMFPSEEEFFDYDDPFNRVIDIDYSHRVDLSQPIIVGPQYSDGKYSVIDGNHRAARANELGKTIKGYFPVKKVNETDTAFNESLDNPYPFKLTGPDESQSFVATANTPNGPLTMEFSSTDFDDFGIDFSIGKSMGKTDAGDEFRVFATVVAMMKKWISTVGIEHVEGFDFGANKDEHASDGRARLYTRFAKQLARQLGWKLEQSTTANGSTAFFRLVNPKPVPRDDEYWDALEENFADGKKKVYNESNPFTDARMNAIKAGKTSFKVGGKTYKVTGDTSDELNAQTENFADGKKPGRKGLAKRSGVNTKASVSSLRKTAKNSSGEKQRMAHWLANMKAGREK